MVLPQNHLQAAVQAVPGNLHHRLLQGGPRPCPPQQVHDVRRGVDGPGGAGGLCGLCHPFVIFVPHPGLPDGDGRPLKIHAVPGQPRDLRGAQAEPQGQQHRNLHLIPPDRPEQHANLLRLQERLLRQPLLGQGGVEPQLRAVFPQDGGQQAVDVAPRLGRGGLGPAPFVGIGLGLPVDGLLHHGGGEPVQPQLHQALEVVAADDVIAPDGGRAEYPVLGGDVPVHRLRQGHGGGVPGDLPVVKLPLQGIVLRLLPGEGGKGAVLPLSGGVLSGVDLDAPGAAGELFRFCHKNQTSYCNFGKCALQ